MSPSESAVAILVAALAFSLAPGARAAEPDAAGRWTVSADVLGWTRSMPGRVVSVESFTTEPRLDARDAGPGVTTGWRLGAFRTVGRNARIEAEIFEVADAGTASAFSEGNRLDPSFGYDGEVPTDDFDFAARHDLRLESVTRGARVSWRKSLGTRWTWAVGARHLSLRESLTLHADDELAGDSDAGRYRVVARNRLTGVQAGAAVTLPLAGPVSFVGEVSAGLLANRAQQSSTVMNGGATVLDATVSSSGVASLLEARAGVKWSVSPRIAVALSYEALRLDGVARAPEQLARDTSVAAFGRLDDGGSSLHHGASVRLTVSF